MIKRLIIFIIIFAVFLTFITLNLENKCDIRFGFTTLNDVPVFLTVFISFIVGFVLALPLVFGIKRKNINTAEKGGITDAKKESLPSFKGGKYFTKKNKTKDNANDS
jgi:uncharacterized membrane protein YciS (DUF1049 family)